MTAIKKVKQAFPGRESAMGYQSGMTKLEYMTMFIYCSRLASDKYDASKNLFEDAITRAKAIIDTCEKNESSQC